MWSRAREPVRFCLSVCLHLCVYVYACSYTCVCLCLCVCVCVSLSVHVHLHVCVCLRVSVCICVSVHACVRVCFCVSAYVCVLYVCMRVSEHVSVCVCPEGHFDYAVLWTSSTANIFVFWVGGRQGFSLAGNSPVRLGRLAEKPQESLCFCLPSSRVTGRCYCAWLFFFFLHGFWDSTQVLRPAQLDHVLSSSSPHTV